MGKFKVGRWTVKYKLHDEPEWKTLKGQKHYWYADPLLLQYNDKKYLFTEAYDEKLQLGKLAVSIYENGNFSVPKVILKKSYHLSYPCVFEYKNDIYMIPETSLNRTLDLYKTNGSVYKWKKVATLLKGLRLADTTIIKHKDNLYLYTYEEQKNKFVSYVYKLNMDNMTVEKIWDKDWNGVNIGRPAGNVFEYNGSLYMPFQNNQNMYGEETIIRKLGRLEDGFLGEDVKTITPSQLKKDYNSIKENITRTHTLSYDNDIEVIDCLYEKDDKLSYLKVGIRKARNFYFRIIKDYLKL